MFNKIIKLLLKNTKKYIYIISYFRSLKTYIFYQIVS